MNKEHFLTELKIHLKPLTPNQSAYILKMYNDIFDNRMEQGELPQVISKELGNPKEIARAILKDFDISVATQPSSKKENGWEEFTENPYPNHPYQEQLYQEQHHQPSTFVRVLKIFCMLCFNLFFMSWFILLVLSILLTGWIVAGAFLLSPILGLFSLISCANSLGFLQLFASILLCGIALIGFLILVPLSKLCFRLLKSYGRWNVRLFKGGPQ